MKRRSFVRNLSLTTASIPFLFKNMQFQGVAKKLFEYSRAAEDRVLVIIRLSGGNDGLSTFIPLDQYDNLMIQRSNVIIPQAQIIPVTATNGFHPTMTGMANMFTDGNLAVIQNVGYAEQNRSHFRSMDIWSYASTDINTTTGWLGRNLDAQYPGFPSAYPDVDNPDPFAISMGYEVSATCQGLLGNFSHSVIDPFQDTNVGNGSSTNDGTYYGSHMEYLSTIISQTNAYGDQVKGAADVGNSLSTLYDPNNEVATKLKYVAQMISGGLKTKIYVVSIDGFDTHSDQVDSTNTTTGMHTDLLKKLSDAIAAFQDDLKLLGLDKRVAGMTFSEFGRQIASNASIGTDHGDAAPMFLFGSCLNATVIGPNPVISDTIVDQAGVPMQIDFRDVYASMLRDWFEVDEASVQALFETTVNFMPIMQACNLGIDDFAKTNFDCIVYPNPCVNAATLQFYSKGEWVKADVYDIQGKWVQNLVDRNLSAEKHHIAFDTENLPLGNYQIYIQKKSGSQTVKFLKLKSN